jgi:hypothetical protein
MQHATRNTQHETRNTQHAICNTQHVTRNTQHVNTTHTQHTQQPQLCYFVCGSWVISNVGVVKWVVCACLSCSLPAQQENIKIRTYNQKSKIQIIGN